MQSCGISLGTQAYVRIERYKEQLFKWNRVHNLSGVRNEAQLDAFIIDALYPLSFLPPVRSAMDIGTGAGFPGMLLAIALTECRFTLVEPLAKRASFLQFIKADLGLEHVTVANCRVEALEPEPFDLVTSRAVTDTGVLLRLSEPFCTAGTLLLFYKGEKVYDELPPTLPHRVIKAENRHYLLIER
ncbi:MAG: 16S rRNA (guanine(527)-N(7))-methyltransferase RsmG [Campylobacterales bacterium]|nr:16S rRNA (guanine(527)-N(7))-methyltransferase RsmG [Campylobacterales bacterium]